MPRRAKHEPMQARFAPHPSGRPRRVTERRGRGYWNAPNVGPVTPSLRRDGLTHAIGFTAHIGGKWEELE
jgi:hypothetical protein